jgi:TrmH family RNA methyltransferase
MNRIDSAANPRYRAWLKLATQARQVRAQRLTLAEGAHLAQAWLDAGAAIDTVLLRAGADTVARDALLPALASRAPVVELAATLYDALGLVEHGIGLTLVVPVPAPPAPPPPGDAGDALYLDGVQDPGNVGALLRVAAAAGVRRVLASALTAALWAPKVLRAAQGAHLALALHEPVSAEDLPRWAPHWIGTALDGAPLWQATWPAGPVGWIVGAEGGGMSAATRAACAQTVRIPIARDVESLNVAAAAAVCLFERQRRRVAP